MDEDSRRSKTSEAAEMVEMDVVRGKLNAAACSLCPRCSDGTEIQRSKDGGWFHYDEDENEFTDWCDASDVHYALEAITAAAVPAGTDRTETERTE